MRALAALAAACLAAACSPAPPPGHVVVYAHDGTRAQRIEEMLAEFTAETGVLATLKTGASAALTDTIIDKQDTPRADVLITSGAADIGRAADNGALRPLAPGTLDLVPAPLRDPDGYWVAATSASPRIVLAGNATTVALDGIAALGDTAFAGRLCLSSSMLPGNRALLAALIETSDNRSAERTVRKWMRNLALTPFASDAGLVDAVRDGTCEIGIVTANVDLGTLARLWPATAPASLYIDGIGVARHATDPDAAQRFVAWVASKRGARVNANVEYVHAAVAGWRDEEARLLAERAGYR